MKDSTSLHQKVQGYIECYSNSDPLSEMSLVRQDTGDDQESAAKWLALAIMHGVNRNAKKIVLSREDKENITVTVKYRNANLPSPGSRIGEEVLKVVRQITHAEKAKSKTLLSMGIGNDSITLKAKLNAKDGKETFTLKFPDAY